MSHVRHHVQSSLSVCEDVRLSANLLQHPLSFLHRWLTTLVGLLLMDVGSNYHNRFNIKRKPTMIISVKFISHFYLFVFHKGMMH